jgi:hypothetical protein
VEFISVSLDARPTIAAATRVRHAWVRLRAVMPDRHFALRPSLAMYVTAAVRAHQ